MVTLDEFESQFRRSAKEHYSYQETAISKIVFLVDTDFKKEQSLLQYMQHLLGGRVFSHTVVEIGVGSRVSETMLQLREAEADLVVSYRLLGHPKEPLHSLGAFIDEASQILTVPLCLLPVGQLAHFTKKQFCTLVLSESIVGNSALINLGVALVPKEGTLVLADLVDGNAFDDYMTLISKSSLIDTDLAKGELEKLWLGLAAEFERECIRILQGKFSKLKIEQFVGFARSVADYQRLIKDFHIDLLIFSGKDRKQKAMSALGQALAVEITDIPLILL